MTSPSTRRRSIESTMSLIQGVWDGKELKEQREKEEAAERENGSNGVGMGAGTDAVDGLTRQMANSKVGKP
jgi:serine/threonine-protein phosphatase 2B catalytic subunit